MLSRIKFDAYVEEFGFLAEIIAVARWGGLQPKDCDSIVIKRADANLMAHVPSYDGATGSKVGIDNDEKIALVLNDGSALFDAVKSGGYCVHNEVHSDNESWSGETVLAAIYRHSVAETLAYIVSIERGYVIRDHHSENNWRVTVYKPAKDFTYSDVVAEAVASAVASVKAEAEF